jgi:hypothetical protein
MSDEKDHGESQGADQVSPQQDTSTGKGSGKVRIPKDLGGEAQSAQKSLDKKGIKRG